MRHVTTNTLLLVATCVASLAEAGPLEPPAGPILPTGKTLTQVEPRIAINSINTPGTADAVYRITQPGSYYLTGNLSGAADKNTVVIEASDVTIDLCGFRIASLPSGLSCIRSENGWSGITIKNGTVFDGGSNGISLGSTSSGSRILDISFVDCSESSLNTGPGAIVERCTVIQGDTVGFTAGPGSVFRDCTVLSTGDTGFSVTGATLIGCTAQSCGGYGFYVWSASNLSGCAAIECGTGFYSSQAANISNSTARKSLNSGFVLGVDSVVNSCVATENGVFGFVLTDRGLITSSTASGNLSDGVSAGSRCLVVGNTCSSNGVGAGIGAGIRLTGADARAEGNNLSGNDYGLRADTAGNFIARNTASGNATNFSGVAGNTWGTIVPATSAGVVNGNSGGGLGTADPNANLAY